VNLLLSRAAKDDLVDATEYHESVSPGGGFRFLRRYERAVQRVLASPRGMPKYHWRTRICQIRRSDYGIVFRVIRKYVYVLGIICLIRHPSYWKSRAIDFSPKDYDNAD
jgi:hypothetical protein